MGRTCVVKGAIAMNIYEVGKPFPGPVPPQDGAHFELGPDGDMVLVIQYQNPKDVERNALKAGFSRYAYCEHTGSISLACWVFKFPAPVLYIDAPFHAGFYQDGRAEKFLSGNANVLSVFVLDGEILTILRYSGLQPAAIDLLRATVRRQLSEHVTRDQYNADIDRLYRHSSEEIYVQGNNFAHKGLRP